MTTVQHREATPSSGHIFRPESLKHFKDAAKDVSWLLGQSLQACQEMLARGYGFGSVHELAQVLKREGDSGPFEARFGVTERSPEDDMIARNERRLARLLRGAAWLNDDKQWLVFELGLFLRASEQRECAEKVRFVLSSHWNGWLPTINGRPLGWRAWMCKWWTPDFELVQGWETEFVRPQEEWEDLVWDDETNTRWTTAGPQRTWQELVWMNPADMVRRAGFEHGAGIHLVLADEVCPDAPEALQNVEFRMLAENMRLRREVSEGLLFGQWVMRIAQRVGRDAVPPLRLLQDFVERPSRKTAGACGVDNLLKDASGLREHWAYESLTTRLEMFGSKEAAKGLLLKRARVGDEFEVFARATRSDEESPGCSVWRLEVSVSRLISPVDGSCHKTLKPLVGACCSVVEPFEEADDGYRACTKDEWFRAHRVTEATLDECGEAVYEVGSSCLYMDGMLDWFGKQSFEKACLVTEPMCALFIGKIVLGDDSVETMRALFLGIGAIWGGDWLVDGREKWGRPLVLRDVAGDETIDTFRNQTRVTGKIAPLALIVVEMIGCGGTWVQGRDRKKATYDWEQVERFRDQEEPARCLLAEKIRESTKGFGIDIILTDPHSRLVRSNSRGIVRCDDEALPCPR